MCPTKEARGVAAALSKRRLKPTGLLYYDSGARSAGTGATLRAVRARGA